MSAPNIDKLLDLWASTLLKHNKPPPFANHNDLYNTIDSIPLGNVAWQSFLLGYNGDEVLEDGTLLQWMTSEYDVWFHDPHAIIKNMIANLDYNHHADVAAVRVFNSNGSRVYKNFILGDWAWEESVRFSFFFLIFRVTSLQDKISQRMVQCLFLSSWEATRPWCLSQPATSSTTHYMCQLALSTTIFAVPIMGQLCWSHSL